MGINFNVFGGGFQHAKSSTLYKSPSYFSWDFNILKNDISFFIDNAIVYGLDCNSKNYGWLLESRFISPEIVDFCFKNTHILKQKFINIFTHNDNLIKLDENFYKFAPANGTWIDDIKIRQKSKLISMIASNKIITEGHKKRVQIANKFKDRLDLFGRGFKEIDKKEKGLENYMFSIVVENGLYDTYFTEKILDCFATGTIPVYLGTKNITKFFNPEGIIFYDENFDTSNLSQELYFSKKNAIQENLEIVKKFNVAEDWIFEKYFLENL